MALRIGQRDGPRLGRNKTHEAFADHQAGIAYRVGVQALSYEQLKHIVGTTHIDRTNFGDEFTGNQGGGLVEPRLGCIRARHDIAQLTQ